MKLKDKFNKWWYENDIWKFVCGLYFGFLSYFIIDIATGGFS